MSLIVAGVSSGVGKTTVTLALLASLHKRRVKVQSFKVGPDYIDPMFHRHITGYHCRNLDPILTSEIYIQECFHIYMQEVDYGLIEGAMGLFDGVKKYDSQESPNNFASTAHISRLLNLPILLVIDCSGLSSSVAAIVHGYCTLDTRINIVGVVLNRVKSDRHLSLLTDALETLNLPILGVLRQQDNIQIPDRHLGLIPINELPQVGEMISKFAHLGDCCFEWEKLLPLLQSEFKNFPYISYKQALITNHQATTIRIAVAYDLAFNFYYQDNLDLLKQFGAELIYWSPLRDTELPSNIHGMYFGGGFPEIFASSLSTNINALKSVKVALMSGIPTIAECGGLMYLCESIIDYKGNLWPMVGVLPHTSQMGKRLTLGYRCAVALEDSPLISVGGTIFGHEFHYSSLVTNTDKPLFQTYCYNSRKITGYEGLTGNFRLHASYIHLHWGANLEIPRRFLDYCYMANDKEKMKYEK